MCSVSKTPKPGTPSCIFNEVKVDEGSLDFLISRLCKLRQHGGRMMEDELWLGSDDVQPRSLSANDPGNVLNSTVVHSTLSTLQTLKSSFGAISNLASSLNSVSSTLQTNTTPAIFHYGFHSLPTELIANINEFACGGLINEHVHLMLVCRRFRSVIVNIAGLWTRLTSKSSPKWHEIQAERSRSLGLTIDISYHRSLISDDKEPEVRPDDSEKEAEYCSCISAAKSLRGHSERCTTAIFEQCPNSQAGEIFEIYYILKGYTFTSLRNLHLGNDRRHALAAFHWSMPVLDKITCHQSLFQAHRSLIEVGNVFQLDWPFGSSLRVADITLGNCRRLRGSISSLRSFLSSPGGSNLQELTLTLKQHALRASRLDPVATEDDYPLSSDIRLTKLRKFTLDARELTQYTNRVLRAIFQGIVMPNLQYSTAKFDIFDTIGYGGRDGYREWAKWMCRPGKEFNHDRMKTVDIILEGGSLAAEDDIYEEIMEPFRDHFGDRLIDDDELMFFDITCVDGEVTDSPYCYPSCYKEQTDVHYGYKRRIRKCKCTSRFIN